MSPKHPLRPKFPGPPNDGPSGIRDTAADTLPRRPVTPQGHEPDSQPGHQFPEHAQTLEVQPPPIEIIDLPADLHISRTITDFPLGNYYLAPGLVERLPDPDPATGLRSIVSGRQYVDLVEGGTVSVGHDAQGHFRAKQITELVPSGPRLERVEGMLKWRQFRPDNSGMVDSELIVTVNRQPGDPNEEAGPSKRPRRNEEENEDAASSVPRMSEADPPSEPWQNWEIPAQHASPEDVTIAGVLYKTVPRGESPDHPIVYIKNPTHLIYDFDLLQATLRREPEQQPRGAIQVPPNHHWEVDPQLPFVRALTDYVATYFPELSEISLLNVARKQFHLANGSEVATSAGLTTLRQVFNDWRSLNITPRPELADPLLMLPVSPMTAGEGISRVMELPLLSDQAQLQRLEFDPHKFRNEWRYFTTTQNAVDLKLFMANLLSRNGYTVFEPTVAQSYPVLVFRRTGHDFVFFMTLHRVLGKKIHIPPSRDQGFSSNRWPEMIGPSAMQAVQDAQAANKLVWLKGGSQISKDRPDAVFIVRSDDPRA
ncbi:hypothetical protein [Pseudomonas izuensis]|uniref:Uncharacterized protein n=1 Tax=Pseudomonas izuensis TaxID=2684212 RepID=A0ABM7S4S0_9PSED|nr:hypothetical protein [Pseudomonas izuensis]BCX69762.1 hypothetical protein LAB08_R44150 [Pseudomonas izuensis]